MSKSKDGKRSSHIPNLTKGKEIDANARMIAEVAGMKHLLFQMVQRVEAMAPIVQQMIITMVILKKKGLITNEELREQKQELMQPVEDGIARIKSEVEERNHEIGAGTEETGQSDSTADGETVSGDSDGDSDLGVSGTVEIQPEEGGTIEGDGECQQPRLSAGESKGSDLSSTDTEGTKQPAESPAVSEQPDTSRPPLDLG